MPYSPLAAGHLTRPTWNADTLRSHTDRVAIGKYDRTEEQDMRIVTRVAELAEKYSVKMQEIALAWHWAKGVAAPIVGATKAKYLDDAAGAWRSDSQTRILPIWRSRMHPTASWARLTATRRRV